MALVTADHGPKLAQAARERGVPLLHKPLRPAALRARSDGVQAPASAHQRRLSQCIRFSRFFDWGLDFTGVDGEASGQ